MLEDVTPENLYLTFQTQDADFATTVSHQSVVQLNSNRARAELLGSYDQDSSISRSKIIYDIVGAGLLL